MFLDFVTLLMLVLVILVKYGTWKHMSLLNQNLRELERVCDEQNQRYKKVVQKREAGERDEKALKKDRYALAAYLERDKLKLEKQRAHNAALEKQLI
ncbi:MAG: hypothetical protein ACO36I_15130 [Candidatus Latescibacterota bacterium]